VRRFEGKAALVTGAASGMGRATCVRFAAEGAAVLGIDIAREGLAETESLARASSAKVQTALLDVARRDDCRRAVAATVESFGRLDVLCNIAGILRFAHSHEMAPEDWDRVIAVNLSGPFFLCQAAIPELLKVNGNIVNLASNAGLMGQAYTAAYCASKAGLVNLTRSLAMEYIKQPIRINAVCPSGTRTGMTRGLSFPRGMDPELMGRYRGMRGISEPEEIAAAIAYVASDDAKSMHGAILQIDNGVTAG
jgi:NAD(P)-dependent dehydrogenase (short-subunit alcohol dehydrogenase family)